MRNRKSLLGSTLLIITLLSGCIDLGKEELTLQKIKFEKEKVLLQKSSNLIILSTEVDSSLVRILMGNISNISDLSTQVQTMSEETNQLLNTDIIKGLSLESKIIIKLQDIKKIQKELVAQVNTITELSGKLKAMIAAGRSLNDSLPMLTALSNELADMAVQ